MDFSISSFLNYLHSHIRGSKEDIDLKIMNKINGWRIKKTPSYIKSGKTDGAYLAYMFSRAGVDQEAAKNFIVSQLGSDEGMEAFDTSNFNEKFRIYFEK